MIPSVVVFRPSSSKMPPVMQKTTNPVVTQ